MTQDLFRNPIPELPEVDRLQDSVVVNQGKLEEGLEKMVKIYLKHKYRYTPYKVFPEFTFFKEFSDKHNDRQRAQWVFLSAYFDHNKDSETHYASDMVYAFRMYFSGELEQRLSLEPNEGLFYSEPKPPRQGILTYLSELEEHQKNAFMRRIMKSPAENRERKIDLLKKYNIHNQFDEQITKLKNKKNCTRQL